MALAAYRTSGINVLEPTLVRQWFLVLRGLWWLCSSWCLVVAGGKEEEEDEEEAQLKAAIEREKAVYQVGGLEVGWPNDQLVGDLAGRMSG